MWDLLQLQILYVHSTLTVLGLFYSFGEYLTQNECYGNWVQRYVLVKDTLTMVGVCNNHRILWLWGQDLILEKEELNRVIPGMYKERNILPWDRWTYFSPTYLPFDHNFAVHTQWNHLWYTLIVRWVLVFIDVQYFVGWDKEGTAQPAV